MVLNGRVAERLGKGLQIPVLRFKSGRDLKNQNAAVVKLVYTRDLKSLG